MSLINLHYNDQYLTISTLGGGIADYYIDQNDKKQSIIYGYNDESVKTASMGDVLFPFPGRVKDCRYEFGGEQHILSGLRIKDGHANHGFAKWAKWQVLSQTDRTVELRFGLDEAEFSNKGFPFCLQLHLKYTLNDNGLTCTAKVKNFGSKPAPFGLGFHPYFNLGGNKINLHNLHLTADSLIETDKDGEPSGKLLPIAKSKFDFSIDKTIGNLIIDNCFADLDCNQGRHTTSLSLGDFTIKIWQDESFPYLQIFTADTLDETRHRRGIAIEPQTCCGYALNKPELGLKVLEPNEHFAGKWGITF